MRGQSSALRAALKTKLLAGVAGFVAAAASGNAFADDAAQAPAPSAAPPADAPKWQPYVDVGGGLGSAMVQGRVDVFVPVQQDLNSLLFFNAGIGTATKDSEDITLGLGYRTKLDEDWILGGYAAFDTTQTKYSNQFDQVALGIEAMSADWDARVNGYLASDSVKGVRGKYNLSVVGTTIGILQAQETGYSGLDGEVGYRVFSTDDTDVRVFAGGYSFSRSGYQDISGPRGRIEVNVFDLDALGAQSRLSLQGGISHDDVRGTDGFVGATLRIPLGAVSGSAAQTLDELDRRMVDPVRRSDNVLTQWQYSKPEPVIIYGEHFQSQPTNTVLYVDNSKGAGTLSDPTSLKNAFRRGASDNAFIVATSYGGPIKTHGITVPSGESLAGGGETFTVKGANSGATFTHAFAPGSRTPKFTAGAANENVFNLSSDTAIYGIDIVGRFHDAIYGHNVANVTIGNVSADGSAGGYDGIALVQDKSQDSNITISGVTLSNFLGDGIDISTAVADGGTSQHTIAIYDAQISNVLGDGISIVSAASAGSTVKQTIGIHDSTVHGAYFYGAVIGGIANGGVVSQDATIDPTDVSRNGGGLWVGAAAYGGGSVSQTVSASDLSANREFGDGVYVSAYASHGHAYQSVSLDNATANSNAFYGINISGTAAPRGTVEQHFNASHVTADHNGLELCSSYGCYIFGGNGLNVAGTAISSATHQAVLAQYITVSGSNFDHNLYAGVDGLVYAYGFKAAAKQNLYVSHSSMQHNGGPAIYYPSYGGGVLGIASARLGASVQQYAVFANDTISNNRSDGAVFLVAADYDAFASQTAEVYGSSGQFSEVAGNKGNGLWFGAYAQTGGEIEQSIGVYYVDASSNKLDGIKIAATASSGVVGSYTNYYSHIAQNIIVAYDTASSNRGDGISIANAVQFGGALHQYAYVEYSTVEGNRGDGVREKSVVSAYYAPGSPYFLPTQMYSNLTLYGDHLKHNHGDGIAVDSFGYGPVYMIDSATVAKSSSSHNGGNGFESTTFAQGYYGLNIQYLTLAGSSFDQNHRNGAYFYDSQYYGPGSFGAALQEVTIDYSDFSHNHGDGLLAIAYAHGNQGRAEQNFSIGYSVFDSNKDDGIQLFRYAANGVHVSGYDCTKVQGLVGGCAFVRQVVSIAYSDASGNGRNGIEVDTLANHYGAVYTAAGHVAEPTLILKGVSADDNRGAGYYGLHLADNNSYIYSYSVFINSHFDHNHNGVEILAEADNDSTIVQKAIVYSYNGGYSSASHNARYGLNFITVGDSTSYAGSLDEVLGNGSVGQFDHNGYMGISMIAQGALNIAAIYNADVSHNGHYGIGLASIGGLQYGYIGGNTITYNPVGLIAVAQGPVGQILNLYYYHGNTSAPMGNVFANNGTNTVFVSSGGATQTVY